MMWQTTMKNDIYMFGNLLLIYSTELFLIDSDYVKMKSVSS